MSLDPGVLKVLLGFAGCGFLGFVAFKLTSVTDKKMAIFDALKQFTDKQKIENIEKTEEKQKVISVNVENKEKLAETTKTKIKEIEKKAAKEITEVLKEDSIAKIHKSIDSDWEDI